MSVIDYDSPLRVLVPVKGHPYQRDEFFDMFEAMPGISYTAVEQPASQLFYRAENCRDYQAIVAYDMPGINFSTQPPVLVEPSDGFKQDFVELLQQGKGMVFLHHSVAGWPLWSEYAEIVGGRFLYLPGELRGEKRPDSGYRHETDHRITVLTDHPVTAGVDAEFSLVDELYLYDVFEQDVIPLLASNYEFVAENFFSATEAVGFGRMYSRENWQRVRGSNLVGWVKSYSNSPVVYLQMGDAPAAYDNPNVRRLIENAIRWVASEEAHAWARARNSGSKDA